MTTTGLAKDIPQATIDPLEVIHLFWRSRFIINDFFYDACINIQIFFGVKIQYLVMMEILWNDQGKRDYTFMQFWEIHSRHSPLR